ncbi:MAG: hypothetical protein KBH14_06510 [Vicinamibacteria bacterium]|nr:hypothetical protein [Vicinamibacteria bacterium]
MAPRKKVTSPGLFGHDETGSLPDTPAKAARKRASPKAAMALDERVTASLARLPDLVERLEALIAEVPRADQFEPLAEHIYSFAQSGPRLMDSLESVKDAVPQIESATAALGETAATLQDTNQRLAESLLRLPAAEDYEPLAAPLIEFTKISPALTDAIREAVASFAAVSQVTGRLEGISKHLKQAETAESALPKVRIEAPPPLAPAAPRNGRVAESLETLANEIDGALEKIPKDPEYARVAEQLRELATVSPSLMEWMKEVKPLSPPLAGSVMTLRRVANTLRENASVLRGEKSQ